MEQEMGVKDKLNKLWDIIYVDYKKHKMELVKNYMTNKIIADAYKTLGDIEDQKKYEGLVLQIKETIEKLDNSVKLYCDYGDLFNWISSEFILAVVKITDIQMERELQKDDVLYEKEYNKAMSLIYIVKQLLETGADEENYYNNIQRIEIEDKIIYAVKDIVLFTDSKKAMNNIDKLYHGTTLYNAKSIIDLQKLFAKKYDNIDNFYNEDKIFFTESLEASKNYAMRNEDAYHVVFEIDVSDLKMFEREHVLVQRAGNLYFVTADELNLKNRISKIYLVEDGEIRESTINEIADIKVDDRLEEMCEEYKKLKKLYVESCTVLENDKERIYEFAKVNEMSVKDAISVLGLGENIYRDMYEKVNFNTLEEHVKYLKNIGEYEKQLIKKKADKDFIFEVVEGDIFYHGTSLEFAKNIVKDNIIKAFNQTKTTLNYNKIFFSDDMDEAKFYSNIGSAKRVSAESNYNIIFECNLYGYDVYKHCLDNEYFVWGNISADVIKHIHLCQGNNILKEITKEELLKMEM